MAENKAENKNIDRGIKPGKQSELGHQNDQPRSGSQEPNPERYKKSGGSAFNEEETATGYGSNQRKQEGNVGPSDADMDRITQ